ncbi:MAG: ATP-binding protein [Candidatus Krumholzibacteria bacterium]|nr:ATP-binding protein [Candidatus Krumholzibacteria bacterium]
MIDRIRGAGVEMDLLRVFLDNDTLGIVVIDHAGAVVFLNKAAERMTGYLRGECVGRPLPADLFRESDATAISSVMAGGGRLENREAQLRRKGGGGKDVILGATPLRAGNGSPAGHACFFIDNTEKRHLQGLLLQSQRMDIVSEMAGGIAHDFNNLLEGILGYASFMMDLIDETHELRQYLEIVEQSARKASELTERLMTFSRFGDRGQSAVDCNALLEEVGKVFERTSDPGVRLDLSLGGGLGAVPGAPGALETALLNVCINARDAMPHGGVLRISSENVTIDDTYPRLDWNMVPGPYVRLSFADTGIGMDAETRSRIFEPFFTTKRRGEGAGLGMTLVYGVVKNHGGFVNVYSEPGEGTVVNIYLPAVPDAGRSAAPAAGAEPRGEGELILVIEDEQMVRDLTRDLLEKLGYRVVTAADAASGVGAFLRQEGDIAAVLLDLIVPGGGGESLRRIREARPEIPVVLVSGYGRAWADALLEGHEPVSFLQKPYSMSDLAAAVHGILHPRSGT